MRPSAMTLCLWLALLANGLLGNSQRGYCQPMATEPKWPVKQGQLIVGTPSLGKYILAKVVPPSTDAERITAEKTRILIVCGLDGKADELPFRGGWIEALHGNPKTRAYFDRFEIAVIYDVCTEPGTTADIDYPPAGPYYSAKDRIEAQYLWRWMAMFSPDLVVDLRVGETHREFAAKETADAWPKLIETRKISTDGVRKHELIAALASNTAGSLGAIPAIRIELDRTDVKQLISGNADSFLPNLLESLGKAKFKGPSPARRTMQMRLSRSPRETFAQLEKVYGHKLPSVQYIPAVAMLARLRGVTAEMKAETFAELEKIAAPFYDGTKPYAPRSGPDFAGALVFAALAEASAGDRRARYVELVKLAADQAFNADGSLKASMPGHSEMSDGVFMGAPILAAAGKLTGEAKYFDACAAHVRFMKKMLLRKDGLYQHSPLDSTAWGRGNGFAALGLALALSDFPVGHPARAELLADYQSLMNACLRLQRPDGTWRQVVDQPSYREFSCTCMIAFAMLRGLNQEWLTEDSFAPCVGRATTAIQLRIGDDGSVTDVCTGTGKQKSLRDYFDREAILGRDDRGGAMALLFVAELLAAKAKAKEPAKP